MRLMKSYKKFNRSNALCISQFNLITDWTFVLFVAGSFDQIEFYLPSSDANQRNNTIIPLIRTMIIRYGKQESIFSIFQLSIRMNKWNHSQTIFNITRWHLVVWIIVDDVEGILSGNVKPLLLNLISGTRIFVARFRRRWGKKVDGNMGKMSITLTVFGRKVRELCVSG